MYPALKEIGTYSDMIQTIMVLSILMSIRLLERSGPILTALPEVDREPRQQYPALREIGTYSDGVALFLVSLGLFVSSS